MFAGCQNALQVLVLPTAQSMSKQARACCYAVAVLSMSLGSKIMLVCCCRWYAAAGVPTPQPAYQPALQP